MMTGLLLLAVWVLSVARATGGMARYDGEGQIVLSGAGNTLKSIAGDIDKEQVFSYNAETRVAECRAGISFLGTEGELTVGVKGVPGAAETLRIICEPDGESRSRSISVQDATLNIYHSRIEGVESAMGRGKYRFGGLSYNYRGGGEVVDSQIHSALMAVQVQTRHPVELLLKDVKCVGCGMGLWWAPDVADNTLIDGLDVSEGTKYGVLLRVPVSRPSPLKLRNTVLGRAQVVMDTVGRKHGGSTVLFVNTMVDPARVWFQEGFGINRIVSAWEQYVFMTDFDHHALPDGKLLLRSTSEGGEEVLASRTRRVNPAGEAWLPLPVSVISGRNKEPRQEKVVNDLEAASAQSPFRRVVEGWTESAALGWRLERQNDGSWKKLSIPYTAPENLDTKAPKNLCANGGFEVTTSPGYPDAWKWWRFFEMKPGGWGIMKPGGRLMRFGIDTEVVYEGEKSLVLPPGLPIYYEPPAGIGTRQLYKGKTYTISFYAKSENPEATITMWRWGVPRSQVHFTISPEWTRYHTTLRDLKETAMPALINAPTMGFDQPDEVFENQGRVWLDAVQIEEGDELHPFMPSGYVCPER